MTTHSSHKTHREMMSQIARLDLSVGTSQHEVVESEGVFRLLRYKKSGKDKFRTPILIVYAWINRPFVLDLQPEISVVQQYLRAGFDVYLIDWGYPTIADRYLEIEDYLKFLDKSVDIIKQKKKVNHVNLHGYCLGGTLSAVYTASRPKNVRNLVLQGAPIDFQTSNFIAAWARAIKPDKIIDAHGLASGEMLNNAFLLADPINLTVGKYDGLIENRDSDTRVAGFLRMDRWIFDSPSVPGATFRQYITEWYQQNLIVKGEFKAFGTKVDLKKIKMPLLVLSAKFDHIVPVASNKAILDIATSRDKEIYEIAKGHVGMITSAESHREFWPKVVQWLAERSR